MIRLRPLLIFLALLSASFVAIFFFTSKQTSSSDRPIVYVSNFALYDIISHIVKDHMDVRMIVPIGSDPHTFSPNPQQIEQLNKSALFFYNGAGFDSWAKPLVPALGNKAIDMSRFVTLIHESDNVLDPGPIDPHYWLDIANMLIMTQVITKTLESIDPQMTPTYDANAALYVAQLAKLKDDYDLALGTCAKAVLVSNHDAFGYIAKAYHLKKVTIIGLSSDEQPSAKVISETIDTVKTHKVKTIFFEELIDDRVAQTIAQEAKVEAKALHPLENLTPQEWREHETYETLMRRNLSLLQEGLGCEQ